MPPFSDWPERGWRSRRSCARPGTVVALSAKSSVATGSDVFRVRESSLEVHLHWLDTQWTAGQRNGTELWRQLKRQGFRGCLRVVSEWASRRRRAENADGAQNRAPSSRTIARLMTISRDTLSKAEAVTVAAIECGVPMLVEAREIIAAFQAVVRKKSMADLDPWLEYARSSLVASFANGITKDRAAVSAAITSPWSNSQTEGQITKLKLVKRQMYGRGNLDLLQARVIGASKLQHHQNCVRASFGCRLTAGLVPATHDFGQRKEESRGCPPQPSRRSASIAAWVRFLTPSWR